MDVNQTNLAIDAALAGQGICLASHILVSDHLAKGELELIMRLEMPETKGFYLVHPHGRCFSHEKLAAISWLRSKTTETS